MPTTMEELDVSELMSVKGGFTDINVCLGASAVRCTAESSGTVTHNNVDKFHQGGDDDAEKQK